MSKAKPSTAGAPWTLDEALCWVHGGKVLDARVLAGYHRSAGTIGRLLEALREGRVIASAMDQGRRRDILAVEWLDLEIIDDEPSVGVIGDWSLGDAPYVGPLVVRSARAFPASDIGGRRSMQAERQLARAAGAVPGFHYVVEDVLFDAAGVRGAFPLAQHTAAQAFIAEKVAEKELRRIIGWSPGLRLLSDLVLMDHVAARAAAEGGYFTLAVFRDLKGRVVRDLGSDAWTRAGRPRNADRGMIEERLLALGLSHLVEHQEIPAEKSTR